MKQGGNEVAADGGQGVDPEDDHQDRGHEGAAAHPREANDEAHDEAGQRDQRVDLRQPDPSYPNPNCTISTDSMEIERQLSGLPGAESNR